MAQKRIKKVGVASIEAELHVDQESGGHPVKGEVPLYEIEYQGPAVDIKDLVDLANKAVEEHPARAGAKGKSQVGYSHISSDQWDNIFGKKKPKGKG